MTRTLTLAIAAVLALLPAARASATPSDCEAARCVVQTQVNEQCPCDPSTNHGQYVSCVAHVVKQLSKNGTIPTNCKGKVTRCAARSTCGKSGFITCTPTCNIVPPATTGTCANDPMVPCTSNSDCGACHTRRATTCPSGTTAGSGTCCAACASPSGAFLDLRAADF
jgi:hypothetical protein